MLKNLLNTAPRCEPLIRIYPNYFSLNAAAAKLLNLREGDSVSVMQDDRDGLIYVSNCPTMKQSYSVTRIAKRFHVSGAPLCRKMAKCLEGFGPYKITEEESQDYMGYTFYNIFKKKYGKD